MNNTPSNTNTNISSKLLPVDYGDLTLLYYDDVTLNLPFLLEENNVWVSKYHIIIIYDDESRSNQQIG